MDINTTLSYLYVFTMCDLQTTQNSHVNKVEHFESLLFDICILYYQSPGRLFIVEFQLGVVGHFAHEFEEEVELASVTRGQQQTHEL